MPIYYLEPRDGQTTDPRWAATSLSEGCWVVAETAYQARRKIAMATIKAGYLVEHPNGYEGRRIPEQARRLTPWLNAHLTDCRPDNPPVEVPEGIIVTVTGKSIS